MNNSTLSNWLIASDIDGTLNDKSRHLPSRNFAAIHKFVDEYGGKFILSSGRSIESMRKHFENIKLNSGLCVFTNGAGIYDYNQEKILWLNTMPQEEVDQILLVANSFKRVNMQVVTPSCTYLVRHSAAAYVLASTSKLKLVNYKTYNDLPKEDWCKVIFVGPKHRMDKLEKLFVELNNGQREHLMRSSVCSFEIVAKGTNKGIAVLKAAELLGVEKEHTAAIGDYFNDYEMLKAVAFPAVCGQAPNAMKKIAKLVTCHCNKGAVADLIEYLIAHYEENS